MRHAVNRFSSLPGTNAPKAGALVEEGCSGVSHTVRISARKGKWAFQKAGNPRLRFAVASHFCRPHLRCHTPPAQPAQHRGTDPSAFSTFRFRWQAKCDGLCQLFCVYWVNGLVCVAETSLKTPHTSFGLGRMFLESGTKFSCLFFSQKHPASWGKVLLHFQRWVFKGAVQQNCGSVGRSAVWRTASSPQAFPVLVQPRPYWRCCLFQVLPQTNLSLDKGVVVIVLCCHPCLNCPVSYRHSSGTSQLA